MAPRDMATTSCLLPTIVDEACPSAAVDRRAVEIDEEKTRSRAPKRTKMKDLDVAGGSSDHNVSV